MVDDLLGGALFHHHAAVHEEDAVRHIPGELHLMGDDDHGGLVGRQVPQHPQHLAGEFRVEGRGGLIETEDIRLQGQGAGDGHTLLLSTRKLVGIMPRPVGQAHVGQQLPGMFLNFRKDFLFVLLVVGSFLGQQLFRQHDVLQCRILGEEVEVLEHQPEMQPLFADIRLAPGVGVGGAPEGLAPHRDGPGVGGFQEIQAAQKGCLAGTRRPDDGDGLALLQRKGDIPQHGGTAEAFADAGHFQ